MIRAPTTADPEVRDFLRDNAMMWLDEFRVDGLRWDSTAWISSIAGGGPTAPDAIPEGWQLMAAINSEVAERFPGRIMIAEDLSLDTSITRSANEGGAGFGAQWDPGFVHPVRAALVASNDEDRDIDAVAEALLVDAADAFKRVIYTESHDEVANGHSRVPEEIWPGYADSWHSRKRAALGAALVLTAPGIPMLFQGQELIEGSWFTDEEPLDWSKRHRFAGLLQLHRDLIRLRRNGDDTTRGLRGPRISVHHRGQDAKVLAFHRWEKGGPRDDVIVVANLSASPYPDYRIGVPRKGRWRVRFNSDWAGYDPEFESLASIDRDADAERRDGLRYSLSVGIGAYASVILSQDE